jgi:hypothetical protein
MVDESGEAGPAKDVGTANKRPAAAIGVAAFIIFVVVVLYLYNGITALFDLGVLGSGPVLPLGEGDSLTEAGRALVAAGFELSYGLDDIGHRGFLGRRFGDTPRHPFLAMGDRGSPCNSGILPARAEGAGTTRMEAPAGLIRGPRSGSVWWIA